jgi:hypothetical protein
MAASSPVASEITPQMRTILVDWLIEVAEEYYLTPQTLFLTVSYIDRFLLKNKVARSSLQLLGVACMLIASYFTFPCDLLSFPCPWSPSLLNRVSFPTVLIGAFLPSKTSCPSKCPLI